MRSADAVSARLWHSQPGDRALSSLSVVEPRRRPSRAGQIAAGERLGCDRGPVGAVHHSNVSFHVSLVVLPVVGRRHEEAKRHLDEVFLKINGEQKYLWRAVDADGNVLDILVQNRRDTAA
jgi:hypothetical protein